jgi:hypothetical protein
MISAKKYDWFCISIIVVLVATLLLVIEIKHPYFFFQDDNRDYFYPHIVDSVRAILGGELALYNFHQYLGTAKLACSEAAVLYPPYYLGYFLSQLFTGNSYATMECIALIHLILAAVGFYRLTRLFGLEPVSCMYGGIAWAFSGIVMIIGNSWMHYVGYAAFLPWVFLYAIRFCRDRKYHDFIILSLLRGVTCTIGQPQLFAYMVVFEFILAVGCLVMVDSPTSAHKDNTVSGHSTEPVGGKIATLSYYLLSFPLSLALAAPILLPTMHQAGISAKRSVALNWEEYAALSYELKLWFSGLITPLAQISEKTWTEQGFISHIGYPALVFLLLAWLKCRESRRFVLFFTAMAIFALLWSSDTVVTSLVYYVPVFNKFRWPFRLAYFTSFFLVMVATFGCSYLISNIGRNSNRRSAYAVIGVTVILLQAVNIIVIYTASPQRMFSRHDDRIPFDEPLKNMLVGGRIVSIGVVPLMEGAKTINGNSLPQLGFNYATLWGLQHFAGYEVLVAKENFQAALKLEYSSVCNVFPGVAVNIPEIAPLDYFRSWGVKWYVVDSKVPLVPTDQLKLVFSDKYRNVLQDENARPLLYWLDDNSAVSYRFLTNSIEIKSDRQREGDLKVNILFNPYFTASIDGRDTGLSRTDDGQVAVAVPGGKHEVEIRYHDRNFSNGMLISLGTLLVLIIYGYILKRLPPRQIYG